MKNHNTINATHLHVWIAKIQDFKKLSAVDVGDKLIPDEIASLNNFELASKKIEFLSSKIMIRSILSSYSNKIHPRNWKFETNEFGWPYIANTSEENQLNFNISHSDEYIVCLVGHLDCLGIDIEKRKPLKEIELIATYYFSQDECNQIIQAAQEEKEELFFKIWTLKESYIKAMKKGVSINLASFGFEFTNKDQKQALIRCEEADNWNFLLFDHIALHQGAIGYRDPESKITEVKFYEFHPSSSIAL